MKKLLPVCLLACALSGAVHAATIWQEDFSSYTDVGITGQGPTPGFPGSVTNWGIDVSACANLTPGSGNATDYFLAVDTSGGRMEAVDIEGEAVWSSESIGIGGYTNVSLSVDTSETGSSSSSSKYVSLFYKLNGGAETAFAVNPTNTGDWGSATATHSGLSGSTIQIITRVNNPNASDKSIFDNVTVSGDLAAGNTAPVLDPVGSQTVTEGEILMFQISAADANDDPLTFWVTNPPSYSTFTTNATSAHFTWSPADPPGLYTIRFYVSDGTTNDYEDVEITVLQRINPPPEIWSIGNKTVESGQPLTFLVEALDSDGFTPEAVTLTASNLPPGSIFNTATSSGYVSSLFNWASAVTGVYTSRFYATDSNAHAFEEISITVTNPPSPPPLTGAVWNVFYNDPQQSGAAYPNQFRIRDALVERIDALQNGHSATLATFTFSAEEGAGAIMNAIDAALDRGALISFIADGDINIGTIYGGANSLLDLSLRSVNPLTLRVDGSTSGILHDKLGLFDYGGTNRWVFTASWNFTLAASADQWNIALEARSPSLYAIYQSEVDELIAGRFHDDPLKSHAHDGSTFTLDGSWGANFVRFAPYPDGTEGGNNAETDIITLIDQAQSHIVFALNKLNRPPIRDALITAANRGVAIQGVMPKSDTDPGGVSEAVYNALTNHVEFLPAYACADYSSLDRGEANLIHAKYMVIDPNSANAIVIHGSANWTAQALVNDNDNDENTVILRHNGIATQFHEHFQRITGTGIFDGGNSVIAEWDFEGTNITSGGISANETQAVVRVPAPSSYDAFDEDLSCNGWNSGAGTKYWETSFSTEEHRDIRVSSVQTASSTGPADFKLQYKIGAAGTYTDVSNATVRVPEGGNGVLARVSLPAACENQTIVFLRWIMISNVSAKGATVSSAGKGRIQDLSITGTAYNQPPVLDPIGNFTVFEGENVLYTVTASDPVDNDPITLSATNLPVGATFIGGLLTWNNAMPVGMYTGTVYATDKDGFDSEPVTITVVENPKLMITEIADPAGTGGGDFRFVELYNAGSNPVDLTGGNWHLSQQANGSTWKDIPLHGIPPGGFPIRGTIDPADTWVIAFDSADFQTAYSFAPDQENDSVNGNGDDAYFLYYGGDHASGTLIDMYGKVDTDGSGEAWEYTDGHAVRKRSVSQPSTTWTSSEWVIVNGATPDDMGPGVRGNLPQFQNPENRWVLLEQALSFDVTATDPIDEDPVVISATDLPLGATFTSGTFNWNSAFPVGIHTVTFIATDSDGSTTETVDITVLEKPLLLISEVADPSGDGADIYRFVELYNAGANAINLAADGWHLSKQVNGGTWSDVELTGTIAADSTWVVANSAADFQDAYGLAPDQSSSSIGGNGDDAYFLYYGGDHENGILIDIHGAFDTDGTGTPWDYEDSRANRNIAVLQPNTTWTASEWTITSPATINDMTPGTHGPAPRFENLRDEFVFLGDDLSLTVTAVNTVKTDVITLSAVSLPAGATFPPATGPDRVSSLLNWTSPAAGTYTATFAATGESGTTTESITLTVASTSRIDGNFYGWVYGTIVKLTNGQFWHNTGGVGRSVHPPLRNPDVSVTNLFGTHRMSVEGVRGYTEAARIEIDESTVSGSFSGLHNGNIYALSNGARWKQVSFENSPSSAGSVAVWHWSNPEGTFLRFRDPEDRVIGTCKVEPATPPAHTPILSRIDGWFRGWNNKRVFALANGQFWQQTSLDSSIETLYRPDVVITNWLLSGHWRMTVSGAATPPTYVEVRQRTGVTRTSIDGWFYGFGHNKIFHLQNGGWWRQSSLDRSAYAANNPEILIWDDNGTDRLEIPDAGMSVSAKQLSVINESTVISTFIGLHYANIYELANGQDWMQVGFENIASAEAAPATMLWAEDGTTHLLARDGGDREIGRSAVVNPWADSDGDQIPNASELIAGTSLHDRNDFFLITDIQYDSQSRAVLSWASISGRIYTVEWTPALTQAFQPLETGITWPQNSWTDVYTGSGSGGFYRIRVQLEN